jgi:conjugal transfer ATP-binding protein TraC
MINFFNKKKKDLDSGTPEIIEIKDILAPSSIDIKQSHIYIGERFAKTFFVFSYPQYLSTAWLSPVINSNFPMDISFFIHPIDTGDMLKKLRKKVTETQAELIEKEEKGLVRDPVLETAFEDMEDLRDRLQSAQEKMFRMGLYLTIYGETETELKEIENVMRSFFEGKLIYIKPALFQQKEGFLSTSPLGNDLIDVSTIMNTEPLSSMFPFLSFDLSSNEGILYGINQHNNSLVLFDRFSLENPNAVIFGTSGSGKSYLVKLEALRYLMAGTDVIIIDPENEYRTLAEAVEGSFFDISLSSTDHINPMDIPTPGEDERPADVLRSNTVNLVGLLRLMLGGLTPEEDAIIDQAISETYAARDITEESDPKTWAEKVPVLSDMEDVLENMDGGESLVRRLRKFTKGAYSHFFNQTSNVSMDNNLVIFGIRNLEEELRPMAMFIVMRYIWKTITSSLKKRILLIDEAWLMMQNEDSASFLFGLVKRSRKYWTGVTTITQDVSDFMSSDYGQPIVNNSALRILLKQSPSIIDIVQQSFGLTDEEKMILLEGATGEGIFFAGKKHVAIRVVASYSEDQIVTTSPEERQKIKQAKEEYEREFRE